MKRNGDEYAGNIPSLFIRGEVLAQLGAEFVKEMVSYLLVGLTFLRVQYVYCQTRCGVEMSIMLPKIAQFSDFLDSTCTTYHSYRMCKI